MDEELPPLPAPKYRRGFIVLSVGLPAADWPENDRDATLAGIEAVFNEGGRGDGSGVGPGGITLHDLFVTLPPPGAATARHVQQIERFRREYPLASTPKPTLPGAVPLMPSLTCCEAGANAWPQSCPWHNTHEPRT